MAMKIDPIQPAGMNVRIQQGKPAYSLGARNGNKVWRWADICLTIVYEEVR
jgi:hypothetical protein